MDRYIKANIIFSKFSRDYMNLKKDLPIRPSEMAVLNIITKRKGNFTPLMIAELLGVTKPMITTHITVLQKKGYITKQYSTDDKRSFFVIPTQKALTLVEQTDIKLNQQLQYIDNTIGKYNFDTLMDLLQNVQSILEQQK